MSELRVTVEEQTNFNYKVKSIILRKEFQLGNIYFNEKRGLNISNTFEGIEHNSDAQRKHKIFIKEQFKAEGFSDCGEIYGYNKI